MTEKYNLLTVLSCCRNTGRLRALCLCECGNRKVIRYDSVKNGHTKSCGCIPRHQTHGATSEGKKPKSYHAWASMLSRCLNPRHKSYPNYGGRGIKVCQRWQGRQGYPNFIADMGEPPEGYSLERKNNSASYDAENCCWADRKTQARNKRVSRMISCFGKTQNLSAWSEETGIEAQTISCRLARGWDAERALTCPSLKPQMKGLKRQYGGR